MISGMKEQLKQGRRTPHEGAGIRSYHDTFLLYTWLLQSLCTSLRPTSRPNALYAAWNDASDLCSPVWAGLADKDNRYFEKARPIRLVPLLETQFEHYRQHFKAVRSRLGLSQRLKAEANDNLPLFVIAHGNQIEPLRPAWLEDQLHRRFAPLPANFHRAFLRTELLERDCSPEAVDAFMGHANLGESPYARHTTFDYRLFWSCIENALLSLHHELGLEPIPSRLVPFA